MKAVELKYSKSRIDKAGEALKTSGIKKGGLSGENNCPPEDVGGPGAFAEYKEAISSKKHERHEEFMNWRGSYNPEQFSVEMANLRMIRNKVAKNLKIKQLS